MNFDRLIEEDAYRMEMDMMDACGLNFEKPSFPSQHSEMQSEESINQEAPEDVVDTVLKGTEPTWNNIVQESPSTHVTATLLTQTKFPKKSKKNPDSDSEQEYKVEKTRKIRKSPKEKIPGYPTKNLLQNMKGPHLEYIESKLRAKGIDPASFSFLKELHSKPNMNLTQYQTLYRTEEFEEILEGFFSEKVLFRSLMVSRAVLDTKKTSLKMLPVFQKAFREKKFEKIN